MTLSVYLASLILGGGLLVFSIFFGGDHDADHDLDMDHDVDMDVDVDADVDMDVDHDVDLDHDVDASTDAGDFVLAAFLGPLVSIRFWTFFTAFFGLTGTLLSLLKLSHPGAILGVSLGMGAACGYAVATLMKLLKKSQVTHEVIPERDYPMKAATVVLEVAPGQPGVVRLEVSGTSIDVDAEVHATDMPVFKRGGKVIVLSYADGKVTVGPFDTSAPRPLGERERSS